MRNQYPDASAIIKFLPASMSDECFKPEAHLLIEKFLSLKNLEGKSRERFVSNMMRHTNVRGKVSSIFKSSMEQLKHSLSHCSIVFFSPAPQMVLSQISVAIRSSSGLVGELIPRCSCQDRAYAV